ncbi:SO_0444 family Cu/Zn efflux transporter [Alteromonas confluentis]|uniref:Permease n=1 Tax=Alteromonas confluentis TaxID=1656094 RepID=A0A1E7Z6Z6_9ALTE|nr:SO_0444 family Cu/Zn efflux transporter [Alteromonas confluentis]OFC69164.1 permease [Alteromonas confluentis]
MNDITLLLTNFFGLFMESAPWLLMGLLVAGIMHELVPVSLLQKHMGKNSTGAVVKSALIGAPLPLCSCGVIPAALGLRRSGASKPATASFLVSTPETGVDSISVSYALLGPVFAIVRPFAAIFSAIYTGMMVKWFVKEDTNIQKAVDDSTKVTPVESCCSSEKPAEKSQTSSCCSSEKAPVQQATSSCCGSEKAAKPEVTSCCSSKTPEPAASSCCSAEQTKAVKAESSCCNTSTQAAQQESKLVQVWKFSTGKLLEDITMWLLLGLGLAAAIQTWVPTSFLTQWGDGFLAMLVMALIGVPMYICATASTPLAVGFLSAGLSPGAILVFLLAGPATNISTMGMIGRELGRRSLVIYLFCILTASIGLGYLLNFAVDAFNLQALIPTGEGAHIHGEGVSAIYALCAVVLGGLMVRNLWQLAKAKIAPAGGAQSSCH